MRKRLLILFTISLLMVLNLCGCSKKQNDPSKVVQFLKELNSYTCDLDIHIKNSKQERKVECKQFYDEKFGHRLDIGDGRILIYKENDILVSDLNNNEDYTLDKNFDSVYKLSFLQEYIGLLYTNEEIRYSTQTICDKEYQLIHLMIPGNNRNISKAIMYVNLENKLPERTVICDIKGHEVISFGYRNFIPNPKLEKDIFENKKDENTNE
ncbi:germination lipoprotein GerS-related protein [Clostridium ganghwense]|uniref:Germination lipoprotein GerS-related protein n=1 Tax=Clostridium ganghwense TaxID=312089 RepID=A0ABT4CQT4_9CLOT|nr:germination lipoprotein GerS-related protein [Clostridium ganghwense]MCY6371283.1 germination lipoprotein GerS-related protein [Clostridium ganghwense]